MSDDEAMIAQYLARGGKVTKCAPGPSENIVYRSGPRFRRQTKAEPSTATPPASPAGAEEG